MKKSIASTVAIGTIMTMPLGPTGATPVGAASVTTLTSCHTTAVAPKKIIIACADANRWISGIRWTGWGATFAHGTGTLHWNTCTPTCVAGTYRSRSIRFTAGPKQNNAYSQLKGPRGSFGGTGTVWRLL